MKPRSERRRGRPATGQSGSRILLVLVSFAALAVVAAVAGRTLSRTPPPAAADVTASIPAERYAGVIRLAPDHDNRCRQFRLDNRTGALEPIGAVACGDAVAPAPRREATVPADGGGDGRIKGIGDYFRAR